MVGLGAGAVGDWRLGREGGRGRREEGERESGETSERGRERKRERGGVRGNQTGRQEKVRVRFVETCV